MKKALVIALFVLCAFVNAAFAQKLSEPKLVGSWFEGEDFGEYIYHKTEELAGILSENPNGNIIVRLCSKNRIPLALVRSNGLAYDFPRLASHPRHKISDDKIFFARYSKCANGTEQYWIVPENTKIDYDEIIPAKDIETKVFEAGVYDKQDYETYRKDFADKTRDFIDELKNNPKTKGFIIRNSNSKYSYIQEVLRQLRKEKIDKRRFQIVRKKYNATHFPEFMTVVVK